MDLDILKNAWQEQSLNLESESKTLDKLANWNKKTEKENLHVSIAFAATILILGFAVMPILESTTSMLLVGALFMLMGGQAFVLWMRNLSVKNSLVEMPTVYIGNVIKKLRYNLTVTNVLMPIYLLLLGTIISYYSFDMLAGFGIGNLYIGLIIGATWIYLIGIFLYGWSKQRKKDREIIKPMIAELEEMLKSY